MDIELSQSEAIDLVNSAKVVKNPITHSFPGPGNEVILKLESLDHMNIFTLSIGRTRFELAIAYSIHHVLKRSGNIPIIRLDVDAHSHKNPDAEPPLEFLVPLRNIRVGERHLHVYVEGFGLSWAFPVTNTDFLRQIGIISEYNFIENHIDNTRAFLRLINVTNPRPEDLITGDILSFNNR